MLFAVEAQPHPTGRHLLEAQEECGLTGTKKELGLCLALVGLASAGFGDQQDALRLEQLRPAYAFAQGRLLSIVKDVS